MEPGCEEIERLHRGDKIKLDELDMDAEDAFWTTQSEEADRQASAGPLSEHCGTGHACPELL